MTKRNQDFSKDILSLIRSSVSPAVLSERLQDFHENDLAEVLRELSTAERAHVNSIRSKTEKKAIRRPVVLSGRSLEPSGNGRPR